MIRLYSVACGIFDSSKIDIDTHSNFPYINFNNYETRMNFYLKIRFCENSRKESQTRLLIIKYTAIQ